MNLEIKSIFLSLLKDFGSFLVLLFIHLFLLHLFVLGYYTFYFVMLIFISYVVYKKLKKFSYLSFFAFLTVAIIFINTLTYEELIFELFLYFNATSFRLYVSDEVLYALIAIHITVLINLKKFEKIWDIMDKKIIGD